MKTAAPSKRVPISLGERSYDIVIKPNGLTHIGQILQRVRVSGRVGIVTNDIVNKLYGRVVQRSLKQAGFKSTIMILPEGEGAKSLRWLGNILDELVKERFERQDIVMALGGGVVGDAAGFAASVYLRGVPFVQIPTTLVAQVDSSVGGKTGINHPLGKNLIGAFYQPRVVVVDPHTLQTLPQREWIAGLAEVIKYGMIADKKFFRFLEDHIQELRDQGETVVRKVIQRCCELKAKVVSGDERESGLRRILNYGHTVGHVLESYGKYRKWIHGEAVAIGMVQEASIANFLGLCETSVLERQQALIQSVGLPAAMPTMTFRDLWQGMQHDKKVSKGQIHCVMPKAIGEVQVIPLVREKIRQWYSVQTTALAKNPRRVTN